MLGNAADQEPAIRAIGAEDTRLHLEFLSGVECRAPNLAEEPLIQRMQMAEEALADQALHRAADIVDEMLIAVLDVAVGVGAPHLLRNGVGQHAQPAPTPLQLQVRLPQLGSSLLHLRLQLIAGVAHCDLAAPR